MFPTSPIAIVLFAMLLFSSSRETTVQNPVYYNKDIAHKAIVSILAISSSVHTSSGSQEIYFADVSLRGTEHQLAKLVDLYPAYGYAMRPSLLRERRKLGIRLVGSNRDFVTAMTQNYSYSSNGFELAKGLRLAA